jgi:hypothetical protein
MCVYHGLVSPVLELVGVVRGPLSVKELRGPSVRFRYAASLKENLAGAKSRAERRKSGAAADLESHGPMCTVLGSRYGRSVL